MNDFNNQLLVDIMHDVKTALADMSVYVHATARDVSTLQRAYAKQERENAILRDSSTRNLSVINAMRRELSELRAGDTRRERVAADKSPAGRRDGAIIALCAKTGCRRSELVGITLAAMSIVDGCYEILVIGKGNKERRLYLA